MPLDLLVFDSRLNDIIDADQELAQVATGFQFIEGPVWYRGCLTFSDIPAGAMYRYEPGKGVSLIRDDMKKANGRALDLQGRFVTCEHAASRIILTDFDGGNEQVLVTHYRGKELNSPNDVVVKSDGSLYFTDPRFGRLATRMGVAREQELPFQGVFRFVPKTGELTLLVDDFENPNGLCFSLDEKRLFVNDSPRHEIRVFDVLSDGTLGNGRLWVKTEGEGPGVPDGMKVDSRKNVYCCARGGLHFFGPDAEYLGILKVPEQVGNFAWGDDGMSVYLTAATSLYRVRMKIPGTILSWEK